VNELTDLYMLYIPTLQSGAAHAILRQEDCGCVQQGRAHRLDA
jgi:hypothetical protein